MKDDRHNAGLCESEKSVGREKLGSERVTYTYVFPGASIETLSDDRGEVGDIITNSSCTADYACLYLAGGYSFNDGNPSSGGGSVGNITNSCQLDSCSCYKHCYVSNATIQGVGCGPDENVMNYCVATSSKSSKKGAARSSKSPKLAENGKTAKAF